MSDKIKHIVQEARKENATEKERQELLSLFHNNELEYDLKVELFKHLRKTTPSAKPNLDSVFEQIWNKITSRKKQKRVTYISLGSWLKIAAVLIIGVIVGNLITNYNDNNSSDYFTSVAPAGSISEIIFPDNSIAQLNSETEIKYNINNFSNKREIFLNGEAWFKIENTDNKPFIVHTPYYDVNVIGTEFNVKAYNDDSEVITTLEKGIVSISSTGKFKINKDIMLRPGEQLIFNKEKKSIQVKNVNTKWFTSWKDNKLIFVNASFKELMVIFERKYGVDIEVTDKEIMNYHYDGTIKNETILEILDIIKQTMPIEYQIVGQKIEIRKK